MKTSPNASDSVKGGSAAASHEARIKYDMGGKVNSPDSINGGSAATNFPVTPEYKAPMGGANYNSGIRKGGTYKVETQTGSGTATNDRAK